MRRHRATLIPQRTQYVPPAPPTPSTPSSSASASSSADGRVDMREWFPDAGDWKEHHAHCLQQLREIPSLGRSKMLQRDGTNIKGLSQQKKRERKRKRSASSLNEDSANSKTVDSDEPREEAEKASLERNMVCCSASFTRAAITPPARSDPVD